MDERETGGSEGGKKVKNGGKERKREQGKGKEMMINVRSSINSVLL